MGILIRMLKDALAPADNAPAAAPQARSAPAPVPPPPVSGQDVGAFKDPEASKPEPSPPPKAATYEAPPDEGMGRGRRGRREKGGGLKQVLRPLRGYESDDGAATCLRYVSCFAMCGSADRRRTEGLEVTQGLAFSLIVIGSILLGLSASGNFAGSVADMKYVGTYNETIAKYSLYIFSGIVGVAACLLVRHVAARPGASFRLATLVLVVSMLSVLACLGLGFYLLSKSAELNAAWWTYLISALMIVQRCLYLVMSSFLLVTIREAATDDGVRTEMLTRQHAALGTAPAKGDMV